MKKEQMAATRVLTQCFGTSKQSSKQTARQLLESFSLGQYKTGSWITIRFYMAAVSSLWHVLRRESHSGK
jgi:hypothetical protein